MIADLTAALKARWRLELAVFVLVTLSVAAWTLASPRTYVSTASLLYDVQTPQPLEGRGATDDALLGTQADIIRSDVIASAVVRREELATAPEVVARWQRNTGGTGDINTWVGRQLLSNLQVAPVKGSRVMTISYGSSNPEFAAQMANGFADAYISERLRLQTDPARTYTRWFEDRTSDVRRNLEQAQGRLAAFQRQSGIVDTGSMDAEASRLGDLSNQVVGAESQAADLNARAREGGAASMDVQSSGVVQGLRSQIATKSAELSQMATSLGPNHPAIVAARAELGALQTKLAQEVGTTTQALNRSSAAANARTADLRAKLEAQRGRMLSLVGDRSQLQVLQRDVVSAQAAYDAVAQRLMQMRLQSEVPSTNVTRLGEAHVPVLPSSPNVPLRLLLGVALGALAAMGIGLALELLRPQVRTAQGLRQLGGVPVLAQIRVQPLLLKAA